MIKQKMYNELSRKDRAALLPNLISLGSASASGSASGKVRSIEKQRPRPGGHRKESV